MTEILAADAWSQRPEMYERMRGEDQGRVEMRVAHWPSGRHIFTGDLDESIRKLRDYEDYHLGKGWRGLAYDYAHDLGGRTFEIRATGRSAATSGDYDEDGVPNNRESDAHLFLLGPGQRPSPEMIQAAVDADGWVPAISRRWVGHDEASGPGYTDCPGPRVQDDIVVPLRAGLLQEDAMEEIPQPNWLSDDVIDRLLNAGVLTSRPDREPLVVWRMYAFLDRTIRATAGGLSQAQADRRYVRRGRSYQIG